MKNIEQFAKVKVLVIGDLMLDRYWWGEVSRISPEAPVPVVLLKKCTYAAGGAANVAANIAGLGAFPILIGIVGNDYEANIFSDILKKSNVKDEFLIISDRHPTIVKTRVIAHSQQVVRIDQEIVRKPDETEKTTVIEKILKVIDEVDIIILSDYAKGLLSENILKDVIKTAQEKQKKVLVDPKGKNYLKYKGATLLTPNKKEAAEACKIEENQSDWIEKAGEHLISENELEAILITQGEEGMTLFKKDKSQYHFQACAREIYDVTGAGDTVIATLGVAIGAGENIETACEIANIAAGIVVEQVGTTIINYNELSNYISKMSKVD